MINLMLNILWSSTNFYLPGRQGGSIGGYGSGSASPPLASILTDPCVMKICVDFLTSILTKTIPEAITGLDLRGQPTIVNENNAWPWWKAKKWYAQIISSLSSRYVIPSYAEYEVKDFSSHFSANVFIHLLGPV